MIFKNRKKALVAFILVFCAVPTALAYWTAQLELGCTGEICYPVKIEAAAATKKQPVAEAAVPDALPAHPQTTPQPSAPTATDFSPAQQTAEPSAVPSAEPGIVPNTPEPTAAPQPDMTITPEQPAVQEAAPPANGQLLPMTDTAA